jgi:hypothetical protein
VAEEILGMGGADLLANHWLTIDSTKPN